MVYRLSLDAGRVALVDDNVAPALAPYRWQVDKRTKGRPRAFTWDCSQGRGHWPRKVQLDRVLVDAGKGEWVRHLNGDTLDCRRRNLKKVTDRSEVWRADREKARDEYLRGVM